MKVPIRGVLVQDSSSNYTDNKVRFSISVTTLSESVGHMVQWIQQKLLATRKRASSFNSGDIHKGTFHSLKVQISIKDPMYNDVLGKRTCEIYDPSYHLVDRDLTHSELQTMIRQSSQCSIIVSPILWVLDNGDYGVSWRVYQLVIYPKTDLMSLPKGTCVLKDEQGESDISDSPCSKDECMHLVCDSDEDCDDLP